MNVSNKKFKKFIFSIFVTLILYFLLVFLDYLFFIVSNKHYISNKSKEKNWFINVVQEKMKSAKNEGYEAAIYPFLYDRKNKFGLISKKNKILPLGLQPNSKVFICDEGYGLIKFKTDKYGFRNNNSVWDKKKFNNSIIIIGDSFAAGHCLQDDFTINNILNKNINTINVSSAGNDSSNYKALANTFIPKIKPKKVLLIFSINDNYLLSNLKLADLKKFYFFEKKFTKNFLIKKNNELLLNPLIEKIFIETKKETELDQFFTELNRGRPNLIKRASKYLSLPTFRSQIFILWNNIFFEIPIFTKLAIDDAHKQCKLYNCELIIAYIPGNIDIRKDLYNSKFNQSIKEYTKTKSIKFFDFEEVIYNNKNFKKYYSIQGSHLSVFGASEFARIFLKKFINSNVSSNN